MIGFQPNADPYVSKPTVGQNIIQEYILFRNKQQRKHDAEERSKLGIRMPFREEEDKRYKNVISL